MGMLGDLWRFATGATPASGRQRRASTDALTSEVMSSYRPGASVGMSNIGQSNDALVATTKAARRRAGEWRIAGERRESSEFASAAARRAASDGSAGAPS